MVNVVIGSIALVWAILKVSVRILDTIEAKKCSFGDRYAKEILWNSRGDYSSMKKAFKAFNQPDERYFYSLCVSHYVSTKILKKWVKEDSGNADAWLCLGAKYLQDAWEARGYGRGHEISESSWNKYFEIMDLAKESLGKAIELNQDDATPWAYYLVISTGCSFELEEKYQIFEEAVARDPQNWAAHIHMIVALSEKWGGSNDEMMKFAIEASAAAPVGSDLSLLFVKAYLEKYKYLSFFEENEIEANKFVNSQSVVEDVANAYDKSAISLNKETLKTSIFARYNVSAWFYYSNDKQRLKNELLGLGERISDVHWRWAGPEGALNSIKQILGIK